jgi:hypothetical protein
VLFTAQIDSVPVPVEASVAAAALAAIVSLPVWLAVRALSRRARAPRSR